ncbi:biopolymer transport protein TolQ [Rubricella aquisinus]|uniref:Tol-Pal system protein TolQ n=1 Tax=Rubricella aquisinus TaxID=2028108 RepID=A0A840WMZ6_9RHOB|nr:protein TolQ [Rubricella aquisinus]MBB5515961.1 biopolymer transport protein TolQ [Rubricella aquisinus]
MEAEALGTISAADFTLTALFLRATLTVKIVMIILVIASIWSWAIVIDRTMRYSKVRRATAQFEKAFWSGQMLDEIYDRIGDKPRNPAESIFAAGMREWKKSVSATSQGMIAGAQQRVDRAMNVVIARENEKLTNGLGVLASVGATSPFIGLFGTVWGIKHSFEQIAVMQSTNLAVVAPGIAEALVATGLGLLAAIPAVIFYNKLSTDSDRVVGDFENFADEFSMILSRQFERQGA